ncbi:lipopolysaccharide biosynthesis protein [Olsenella urininfantis]|uniref:lipopolysaccharide biosynthesis protein n=1 Tax=Olsenella urininfantis TaxID=1871033 RepID=UPI001F1A75C1|nr:oligosaccharide flippase family protein [Olsenella urininfantis]
MSEGMDESLLTDVSDPTQRPGQMAKSYLWNTLGSLMNAGSSVLMLLVVTRSLGAYAGGLFSIAFAIAQQFQVVGHFEMRTYQATDAKERFSFGIYLASRILTCILMILLVIAYSLVATEPHETLVLLLIASLRLFDAFEDVFHGMFQQHGRLDVAGRAFFFRGLTTVVTFSLGVILTHDIASACVVSFVASLVVVVLLDILPARSFVALAPTFDLRSIVRLLLTCLPLFVGSFLLTYLSNAPKYGIEGLMTKDYQTYYSVIFMPSLVINLLSGFVFKPLLTDLAAQWTKGNVRAFFSIVTRGFMVVCAASLLTMLVAYPLGTEVLSAIYGVDVTPLRAELMVLLVGGLLNALSVILFYAVVTMRMQRFVVVAYGVAALFSFFAATPLIAGAGLMGACMLYDMSMFILSLAFLAALVYRARRLRLSDGCGSF